MLKDRIQRIKRKWIDGMLLRGWRFTPSQSMILETTNLCSLKCTCCPNGVREQALRKRGLMSRETFDIALSHIDLPVRQCFLHMCGEPLLNQHLPYFAEKLLERKITPIIFSNGYRIDSDLLERLLSLKGVSMAFSMDLLSEKHYEGLRTPGKFETAVEELTRINALFTKKNRFYGLNIIVDPAAIDTLDNRFRDLFQTFSHLNKISLSSRWPWPHLPQTGDIAGHLAARGGLCKRVKELPVILWNGDVSFCSFDYSGELIIGNIKDNLYSRLFNGKRARKIRRHLLTGNEYREALCQHCLLPRYESYSSLLTRRQYQRMTDEARDAFIRKIKEYYEI